MATGNPDFDAILSTTLKKYAPRIEDNVFKNNALLYYLTTGDRIERVDGGESLVEPLMYGKNSTVASYGGYDPIDTTPQEGITSATYPWRQTAGSISISGIEEAKNRGMSQVVSLFDAKMQQLEMSLEEWFETTFYLDGTGNAGKDFLGIGYFIPDDPTTGTVGGIDRADATNAWWRPTVTEVTGVLTLKKLSTLYNTISRGKDHPDFGLTDQKEYQAYELLLQPQQRFENVDTAGAGFENLLYKQAAIMYAELIPLDVGGDSQFFMLNSKYAKLKVHSDVWFKPTAFVKPTDGDYRVAQVLCYGNLAFSNCARQGKLKGLTDTL